MAAIKDHFNGKVDLDFALKQVKGKKCAFVFGIGKSGSWLALDYRNQFDVQKLEKELKKTDYKSKYIIGTACVNGKVLELATEKKKNNIRPIDVRDFLVEKKLRVTRAVIDGAGSEEKDGKDAAEKN